MAGCCPPGSWPACKEPDTHKPAGEESKLGDLPIYTVGSGEKAVLILPDIFGWGQKKGRFFGIADTLAAQGFTVLLADPFYGDTGEGKPDLMAWIGSFPYDKTVGKDIEACVQHLKEKGCSSIGFFGFCWGVWAGCKAGSTGVPFTCGVGPHPSTRLEGGLFGGDEQAMVDKCEFPILLLPAGNDPDNLKEGGGLAESVAKKGGKSVTFPDMVHGWVARGDLSDSAVARDVEAAMKLSVEFFKAKL